MQDLINEAWDMYEKEERDSLGTVIEATQTFDDLITVLDSLGRVKSGDGATVYSADEIVAAIANIRAGSQQLNTVTRAGGIRNKVSSLLSTELIMPARNHEELEAAISRLVFAHGTQLVDSQNNPIETSDLLRSIKAVLEDGAPENMITRNYGLRAKVVALRNRS